MTGNIFRTFDRAIITAFIDRESRSYRWQAEDRREIWRDKIVQELMDHNEGKPAFNYARIQSMTNMGLVDAELVLSTQQFDFKRGDIKFLLPPSPRGGIGISTGE